LEYLAYRSILDAGKKDKEKQDTQKTTNKKGNKELNRNSHSDQTPSIRLGGNAPPVL
jgi:hypothetical protein